MLRYVRTAIPCFAVACALSLVLVSGGSPAPAGAAPTARPEVSRIEIYSAKDAQMAVQALIASNKGYFKDEGLEVDLKYYQSASEIPPGMIGGSIKIGLGGWVNPFQVAANDFPVKIVAQLADIAGTTQLVTKSQIKSAKDLEGKKVGMLNIPIIRRFLVDFAKVHQVDINRITVVNAPPSDAVTAFARGDVDAVLIWEPFTSEAIRMGGALMHTGVKSFIHGREGNYRVYFNYGVVFMADDFAKKNPRTVEAVLRAMARAQDLLAQPTSHDEVARIIAQPLGISSLDLTRRILRENVYTMQITPEWLKIMQQEIEFYVTAKMLKKSLDPKTLVDGSFLKRVRPDWVTAQ
jgi:ABC-type nitrate/sulfonate/bicarbonate transport system substrate-binding protein